jgi:hypothetical protein
VPVLQRHHESRGHLLSPRRADRRETACPPGQERSAAECQIQFFLRLHGLWEGIIDIPPPPDPPFDIETFEPIEPPWQAILEWIPAEEGEPSFDFFYQRPDSGKPVEIRRENGNILVLDFD